jgi:hypothetical protein
LAITLPNIAYEKPSGKKIVPIRINFWRGENGRFDQMRLLVIAASTGIVFADSAGAPP